MAPHRRLVALGLPLLLTAAACAAIAAAPAGHTRPPAKPQAQAAPSPSSSKALQAVSSAIRSMTRTRYQHRYYENRRTGVYLFDCVGLTDYFLRRGAPQAWANMHATLGIRRGYVPRPTRWARYLRRLPPSARGLWQRVERVSAMRPGDFILMDKVTDPNARHFVGHAMIAASAPRRLADRTYALKVYDSTATAHGDRDSRLRDPRAIKLSPSRRAGSGLGFGTVSLVPDAKGRPARIAWSLGRRPVPTPVTIGRPLR
jgi:hypothetical protein